MNATPSHLFDNYHRAKHLKLPPWAGPLLAGSAIFVASLFVAMWIKVIWQIDQVDKPKISTNLAIAAPPPPPPPPPKGSSKPQTPQQVVEHKKKVTDIVQPVKIAKQEKQTIVEDKGDPNGEEGGVEGGQVGGVVGGDLNGVGNGPPPPPPPPAPPANVPPTMLEGSRIAGEKQIVPDDVTKTDIQRSGKEKIVTSYKLCITVTGDVSSVQMLKTSGYPSYDQRIQRTIKNEWKYRPYAVNGKVVPVCTAVTFMYSQK
jgi:protein TonB